MSESHENNSQQDLTSRHNMASVGLSWALAQTVDGALTLGRDTALAASSDNVQPLALQACEKFGGTLAVSSLARTKMEAIVRQQSKGPAHKFLLAKIGYGKGGSLDALSKTAEGIRFLCIASALVVSCSNFEAANTLIGMIEDTAEDKQLSPTAYQVKDILDVLEPCINRFRFLDDASGYQTLISQSVPNVPAAIALPCSSAIQTIVESFRKISRIGDADAMSIRLTVGIFAPWLSAFARMCIETPPAILNSDGSVIIDQKEPSVVICVSEMSKKDIEIDITYSYGTTHRVIDAVLHPEQKPEKATGMVSVQTHARLLLSELQFVRHIGQRALKQALPHAVHLIKSAYAREVKLTEYASLPRGTRLPSSVRTLQLLPEDSVVETIMKCYLPGESEVTIEPLPNGLKITDLPVVKLWMQEHQTYLESKPDEEFLHRLSYVVADILALSLLVEKGVSEPAKLTFMALHVPRRELSPMFSQGTEWKEIIEHIFRGQGGKKPKTLQIEPILNWTLKLLGHEISDQVDKHDWVASSFRGQVLLPRVLLTSELSQIGLAQMALFPGTIMLESQKDRRFSWILSKANNYERADVAAPGLALNSCWNPFTKAEIKWMLATKSDHLSLEMAWTVNKNTQRPMHILTTLTGALMMGRCVHDTDAPVTGSSSLLMLAPGSNMLMHGNVQTAGIGVYPLHGNEGLKLLALASISWLERSMPHDHPEVIINRGACINCLQGVAQLAECPYIIL